MPAGPAGDVSVSIVLPSASSRSEVNSQAKPGNLAAKRRFLFEASDVWVDDLSGGFPIEV